MKIKQLFTLALAAGISATSVAETEYGIDILNTGKLTYSVASDPATVISAESEEVKFSVDRKVIFTLDAPDSMAPAGNIGTQQNVAYTLTNSSNAKIRFVLSALDLDSGEKAYLDASEVTDDTNTNTAPIVSTDYTIWNEVSGAGFNSTTDDNITLSFVELDAGATTTIYVVTTASKGFDQNIFVHRLEATAKEPTGSKIPGNTGGENIVISTASDKWEETIIQTVVNGKGLVREDRAAVQINSATLSMIKTMNVLSDPINGELSATVKPKAIPGAVVEYTLIVTNKGLVGAKNVVISDELPVNGFDLTDDYIEVFSLTDGSGAVTEPTIGSGVEVLGNTVTFDPMDVPASDGVINGEVTVTLTATLL